MQEKYLEFKLGAPDYVTVETEEAGMSGWQVRCDSWQHNGRV